MGILQLAGSCDTDDNDKPGVPAAWWLQDTSFKVTATSPSNGAAGVCLVEQIVVSFNKDADPSTVNSGTITVNDGLPVPAQSVTYDSPTQTATWVIQTGLTFVPSTVHTVTLSGIFTPGGEALPVSQFTFTSNVAFQLSTTIPDNGVSGVATNSMVTVNLNKPMNTGSVVYGTSFFVEKEEPAAVWTNFPLGSIVFSNGNATLTFTPSGGLFDASRNYRIRMTTGVTSSKTGESMIPFTNTFTVGATADVTPPILPAGSAASVQNAHMINVTWPVATDPGGTGVLRYEVHRSTTLNFVASGTTPGVGTNIVNFAPGTNSFLDGDAPPNGPQFADYRFIAANDTHYYRIRVWDNANNSTLSAQFSGTTPLERSFNTHVYIPFMQNGGASTINNSPACSSCHTGPCDSGVLPARQELANSAAAAHACIVSHASFQVCPGQTVRVVPFDANSSLIYNKVNNTQSCGNRMPDGGPFLDPSEIDTIRDWIDEGAQNN